MPEPARRDVSSSRRASCQDEISPREEFRLLCGLAGYEVEFEHVFSCDEKASSQKFIRLFCCPGTLFKDVMQLAAGRAFDVITTSIRPVRAVMIVVAGFVCTDISHCNLNSKHQRACIKTESARTGKTFSGVYAYCAKFLPRIVLLENVTAIDDCATPMEGKEKTNGDMVVELMQKLGYAVQRVIMQPFDHGVPQRRARCWFMCALVREGPLTVDEAGNVIGVDVSFLQRAKEIVP